MKKVILFLFAIGLVLPSWSQSEKEIPADQKSEPELKESQEKGPSNPLEVQLSATSSGVPRILVGSNSFNQVEAGRLSFDEDGDGTSGICGFEFDHNGSEDKLSLISGCYIPSAGDTLFVGSRIGNMNFPNRIGIGSMDAPNANLDVTGSVRITNGTEGAGKVLTSDAFGNATWETSSGSSAIATAITNSGNGTAPTATLEFLTSLGTAVTITSSTQTVQWTATQSLGSSAVAGAGGLDIYPGYRLVSDTTPSVIGSGIFNLSCAENTRQLYTISGTITGLAPGDYYFGMAGDDDGNGNWNSNEWGYVSILT